MSDEGEDTIGYYDRNATRFAADTADLDMSALHDRFLRHLPPGGRILDAGCGVGRDALAFAEREYSVVAFDGSAEMVRLARERLGTGAEVRHMRFGDVAWREEFDGIWACASLLHVPAADFPAITTKLAAALRAGGAWYMSFKVGEGEHIRGARMFMNHSETSLRAALKHASVTVVDVWTTADVRPGRQNEGWINAVAVRA
ncbi:class I SAM-dependent methyltransferase [Belnapia sp. T6]|uniref:Class I SAM-dependent methyltransferase n=1 Tax=Belnapia mucosa TaxID=2804532 RepID=A0ABS1VCG7_9PROT|nr:class I SAM-dependent methyltransferase [Belnapia mucosa]MBL6459377.1 class I SAM-dependent methyltransferase [Belnapia mucosa]